MTTFGLIAGGCHNAWCWEKLIPELSRRGYQAVAPTLPTDDPKAGLEEYVSAVAAGLAGVDGPIILVGHSMAGYYLPLAAARVHSPPSSLWDALREQSWHERLGGTGRSEDKPDRGHDHLIRAG